LSGCWVVGSEWTLTKNPTTNNLTLIGHQPFNGKGAKAQGPRQQTRRGSTQNPFSMRFVKTVLAGRSLRPSAPPRLCGDPFCHIEADSPLHLAPLPDHFYNRRGG
jgi:hypothetical protein